MSDRPPPAPRRPADWKLPAGVAPGTWDYTHAAEIADGYDAFLAGTALTTLDLQLLGEWLPPASEEGAIVADFGCGTGRTADLLLERGYRMLGIDLSQSMLRNMRRKTAHRGSRVMPLRANLVTLDCLADQSVAHAVCLFSSLGMVRSRAARRRVIGHAQRILRPGGMFIVHAHNRWAALRDPGGVRHLVGSWWHSLGNPEADFGDRTYAYRGLPNMFLHSYGRRELSVDLRQSGLVIERVVPLSVRGDGLLRRPRIAPGLRAGGFIAVARRAA